MKRVTSNSITASTHYQWRFSETYPQSVYDREARERKAKTIIPVLKEIYLFGVAFSDRNVGEWVVERRAKA